jgi:psiF repeat
MKTIIGATALFLAIGVGAALAQTDTPAPAAPPAAGSKMTADQKKAISKSCSDQANAKGLHGELRKKFRSACKKAGGKAPE